MAAQKPGWIVVLNGTPRSGKSSIAAAMQEQLDGIWINLGVDTYQRAVPAALWPSIGLRPGGERPDIETHLPVLFAALYESIAAHSRLGLNVVVDIGHHEAHSKPLDLLRDGMRRLDGLPALIVGVRCPLPTILERRGRPQAGREGVYERCSGDRPVPAPVLAWQEGVHAPGIYDLDLDTSELSPQAAAERIGTALREGVPHPTAAERLAESGTPAGTCALGAGETLPRRP